MITSGKAGFFAGADLGDIGCGPSAARQDAAGLRRPRRGFKLQAAYRALETCGKPVAAAINGLALGGGLEI